MTSDTAAVVEGLRLIRRELRVANNRAAIDRAIQHITALSTPRGANSVEVTPALAEAMRVGAKAIRRLPADDRETWEGHKAHASALETAAGRGGNAAQGARDNDGRHRPQGAKAMSVEAGKRYLLRRLWSRIHEEHAIEEVSPSGKRIKSAGNWLSLDDYHIVEELPLVKSVGSESDE